MSYTGRVGCTLTFVAVVVIATFGVRANTQQTRQGQLPNPYRLVEDNWLQVPVDMNGGEWGEIIRVDFDPKGNIWVLHRCFNTLPYMHATCVGRETVPPILQFDPSGKLLTSFGEGVLAFAHGFTVDGEGNAWAADANRDATVLGVSAKATVGPMKGLVRGHQVFKFSPTGKILMVLGKAGVAGNGPDTFDAPTGVAVAANGDIFVSDGQGKNDRVVKFSKDGRFIEAWGHRGSKPGEFAGPHDLSIGGSQGHVFVADRGNNRVQVFDQDGNFIAAWKQFGRPSAVFVSKDDTLYVSDSQSTSKVNPGGMRGIYVGSAKDGKVTAFIPDPDLDTDENGIQSAITISGASGLTADDMGNIYTANVATHNLRKYVKVK